MGGCDGRYLEKDEARGEGIVSHLTAQLFHHRSWEGLLLCPEVDE